MMFDNVVLSVEMVQLESPRNISLQIHLMDWQHGNVSSSLSIQFIIEVDGTLSDNVSGGGWCEVKWSELTQFDSLMWQPTQRSLTFGSSNWQKFPSYSVALPRSSSRWMRMLNEQDVPYSLMTVVRRAMERNYLCALIWMFANARLWHDSEVNEGACECQYQQTTNQTKLQIINSVEINGKVSFRLFPFSIELYSYLMKANRSCFNDFISTLPLIRTGCCRLNSFNSR